LLEAESISSAGKFTDVNLRLQAGMIIGLAGSVGSGRSDVLRALAGLDPVTSGRILFRSDQLRGPNLAGFIRRGICLVPSDRDQTGLILSMSVAGNTTLANLEAVTRGPLMDLGRERILAEQFLDQLDIQAQSVSQEVQYLSGGNRQKVMLSKWLCRGLEVFLLDEPTQGVDVGAREEIHRIMKGLLEEGKGIVMVTSDLDELMKMSHHISVMHKGQVVAHLDTLGTTREEVLSYALGQRSQQTECEPAA
jgi:ribose transport system ATP-binding protein